MTNTVLVRAGLAMSATVLCLLGAACSTQVSGTATKSGPSAFPAGSPQGSGSSSSSAHPTQSPSVTPSPGVPTSKKGGALGAKLQQIAVQRSEVAAGVKISLIPGGADVDGEVTLDNCGYDFTTENFRVARRQYAAEDPTTGLEVFSNELVAYDTAAHAGLALNQWHTAAATCPTTPTKSSVADEPPLLTKVTRNDLNATSLPVKTNAITVEDATLPDDPSSGTLHMLTIMQLKGVVLDILYFNSEKPITAADLAKLTNLATVSGQRLATLA